MSEGCSHSWETCPVHGTGTDELPPFDAVITCTYGGSPLVSGGTWDESTTAEVWSRVLRRLELDSEPET